MQSAAHTTSASRSRIALATDYIHACAALWRGADTTTLNYLTSVDHAYNRALRYEGRFSDLLVLRARYGLATSLGRAAPPDLEYALRHREQKLGEYVREARKTLETLQIDSVAAWTEMLEEREKDQDGEGQRERMRELVDHLRIVLRDLGIMGRRMREVLRGK